MSLVQAQSFAEELRDLKANKAVKSSSRLAKLKPVLEEAVLHVGGRLEEAVVLCYDEKHPIVLPKKHHFSQLIVRYCHESLAHFSRRREKCSGYSEAEVWRRGLLEIASSVAG